MSGEHHRKIIKLGIPMYTMRKFSKNGGGFVRGTIDASYKEYLMALKKSLKQVFPGIPEPELTLPCLMRYDRSITPLKFRVIIKNEKAIRRILRGE